MQIVTSLTILSALMANVMADPICGPSARFMAAIVCGDGSKQLHCAPNNLKDRSNFCQNPNDKWAKAKCNNKGGLSYVDVSQSGCFAQSLNLDCDTPIAIPSFNSTNLGFDLGDLSGWTTTGPDPAVVVCDDSSPDGSHCFAKLTTSGTGPGSAQNELSRTDLLIPNYGSCNNYNYVLSFWYRFDAGDYTPFNDYLSLAVKDQNNNVLFTQTLDVNTVGSYGSSGWRYANVGLGQPPAGSALLISLSAATQNGLDYAVASYSYLDAIQIYAL